ncbi:Olfactory receptor, partial [Ophiophagus hannah]
RKNTDKIHLPLPFIQLWPPQEHFTEFSEGCIVQFWFFGFLAATECYLIATLQYASHFITYISLMDTRCCIHPYGKYAMGQSYIHHQFHSLGLYFCGPNEMDQFVCDMEELIKLSCKKSKSTEMTVFLSSIIVTLSPFLFIIISYVYIISAVFSIASSVGRQKAFSTCVSHITVVSLYYGTIMILYVIPKRGQTPEFHKGLSVIYTVVTPMLNPIVYSLRNKDVKESFKKLVALNLG